MQKHTKHFTRIAGILLVSLFLLGSAAQAQTSIFTYQGKFTDTSVPQPTNGTYNMQFALYAAETNGTQNGATITNANVQVSNGVFSAALDFGANAFSGADRFLEIRVFNPSTSDYVTLTPRQQITSAPYSIKTISANMSDALSANCVGCVNNAQINSVDGAKVTGTVANATTAATSNTATTAGNVSGVISVANGGTGSTTQNFVDLTTSQNVGGNKTFTGLSKLNGGTQLQNLAADPETPSAANTGRIYYNMSIKNLRLSNGTEWITVGQPLIYHVYNTSSRTEVNSSTLTLQPGMSRTIVVPNGFTASVVINASIGAWNSLATADAYSTVDFVIYRNNSFLPKGGYNRFTVINTATGDRAFATSVINTAINIGAGTHTFEVRTSRLAGNINVNIGGNPSTEVNQGEMTLTVYYTPATFVNLSEDDGEIIPAAGSDNARQNLKSMPKQQ